MRLIGKGNANIVFSLDDENIVYRCLVRYDKLSKNNLETQKNYEFMIETSKKLLKNLVCLGNLVRISLLSLPPFLSTYVKNLDSDEVILIEMPNFKPPELDTILQNDHFTTVLTNSNDSKILLEMKPKWLFCGTDFCRNCTHNNHKLRDVRYCYCKLINSPKHILQVLEPSQQMPKKFSESLLNYMENFNNVFQVIYSAQSQLQCHDITDLKNSHSITDNFLTLMALRDVSVFIKWSANENNMEAAIIDVDLKPKSKWSHWAKTQEMLNASNYKVYHDI